MAREKTINVAVVVASLDIIGGQSIQALRLVEGLAREPGVTAELIPINPRLPGPLARLQRIKYVRTVVTSIAYIATLLARLPRMDVVHVFSASYLSFLIAPAPAILIAKLYGKPVLLNYHSGEAEDHLRRWRPVALPIIKLADCVVVPSRYLVDVFAKFGVRARAIFNTVDLARFGYRDRRPLRPVLLSNRNLESHYHVACILRAFALVERRVPGARLIVAGDGKERARLRNLARELGLKNVEFLGAVAPDQMPALYAGADLFVNASDVDNMPLSIIEAFACGLGVVTTDAGGIPHIVSHGGNGLLVRRGDHEALARAITTLVEDEELASRLINTARLDCLKYTWAAVGSEWLSLYGELAGHAEAGRGGVDRNAHAVGTSPAPMND